VAATRVGVELVSLRVEVGILCLSDQLIHGIVIACVLLWDELFMEVV
jgi:hypothetical protein